MNVYAGFKPAWHIDKISQLREGKDIVPTHIQLIISDLCNQSCAFCAYRMEGGFSTELFADEDGNRNPKRFIPRDKCLEILDDCAALGVKAIQFTGGGEPTVHPDHLEIIGYAQKLGLQTGLVTNGVLLKDNEVFNNLDWLRISLDAGRQETYESVRKSKAWPKVLENMALAAKLRGPYVGVGFVVTKDNYTELYEACVRVKSLGIPYVRVSAMFSDEGSSHYKGIFEAIKSYRLMAKRLEDENFKVFDMFQNRIEDLDLAAPSYSFCGFQQFVLYIGGDQKLYTCCTNAYTLHGEIGDLRKQRFKDWLISHRRYDFDARTCHHCQFNEKNAMINYLLHRRPQHVDFV